MGMLTDEGAPDWHPAPQFVHNAVRKANAEAKKLGINIVQLAVQFAFHNSPAHTTLIGMKTVKQVEDNLRLIESEINEEQLNLVLDMIKDVRNVTWVSGREEHHEPDAYPQRQFGH